MFLNFIYKYYISITATPPSSSTFSYSLVSITPSQIDGLLLWHPYTILPSLSSSLPPTFSVSLPFCFPPSQSFFSLWKYIYPAESIQCCSYLHASGADHAESCGEEAWFFLSQQPLSGSMHLRAGPCSHRFPCPQLCVSWCCLRAVSFG